MNKELENLKLIKNSQVKQNLKSLILNMENLFIKNGTPHGLIFSFFKECVNGQILISLDKKPKCHTNGINDFYIDDRVGFKNMKKVLKIKNEIAFEIFKIVKQCKPKIIIGDIVKPSSKYPSNVVLRDRLKINPDLTLKIVAIQKDLNPHYTGYYAVNIEQKPFKKNWIYVGSDDIIKDGKKAQIDWLKDEIKIAKLQNNSKALKSLQKELETLKK